MLHRLQVSYSSDAWGWSEIEAERGLTKRCDPTEGRAASVELTADQSWNLAEFCINEFLLTPYELHRAPSCCDGCRTLLRTKPEPKRVVYPLVWPHANLSSLSSVI